MSAIPERAFASHKSNVEAVLAFQSSAFSAFEKLIDLNVKVARATLDEASSRAQEILALKDPQQALAYTASIAQPSTDKVVAYGKHVYDIIAGVQAEIARLSEAQIAEHQQQITEALEQLAKNAPAGSESAVALLRSTLANASSAYDTLNKAARQAAEVAESNITAATNATFEAADAANETVRANTARAARRAAAATPAASA
ncbi:phasin family protein [Pigmentiphaga aceris]|uniref:Phasin family protein n=1 Tax=Pigmentiphaga aceris TaxID=1940612 RepID=A0A5C0AZK0_9BURK|nr:TIGR01841 family phasin [Pigmentiphaga aceris]QEI07034.1 phasin family protein [Pigmentiphaga aceris]